MDTGRSGTKRKFKIVFLGEGRVGKTSIGLKWCEGSFDPQRRSTVQAGFYTKNVESSQGLVEINLWDTAGQEEYHAVAPIYYKDSQAAILVFSVVDQISFDKIVQWHNELINLRGDSVKIVVVANKIDLVDQRVIPYNKGEDYARSINCQYFEVSARTGQGIPALFQYLVEQLVSIPQKRSNQAASKRALMIIDEPEEQKPQQNQNSGCCG